MTGTRISKSFAFGGLLALVFMLMLACAFAAPAYAKELEAPINVADDITRLHVEKLDADTHEPVIGATLVIVDEDGNTVAEWVSDGSAFELDKGLNVDVVYTLKELNAPEGYSAISPISFVVDPIEGNGIHILSGDESQYDSWMEFSSLAEGVHNKLNLYDKAGSVEVVTEVTKTRGAPSSSNPTKAVAPKTGDETPLLPIGVAAAIGIIAIVVLQLYKRRLVKGDDAE